MDGLRGKKVFFIGDSIMAQDGKAYDYDDIMYNTEIQGTACKGYPTLLKERLGIEIYRNTAVGGHTVKMQREIVMNEDVAKADVFVIAVGVNDFTLDTPIGKLPIRRTPSTRRRLSASTSDYWTISIRAILRQKRCL